MATGNSCGTDNELYYFVEDSLLLFVAVNVNCSLMSFITLLMQLCCKRNKQFEPCIIVILP